ncbi:RNA polymerase sigma-70 factor (ECF subfamily) [Chitinophaga niastensis]|uniref:RNA polymerase sigma-70 factor (ECF subfamily) n=1 Tax=Chitinophaga niastensis TaxID=536980 RepID=A0A2P8HUF7_CHINA|nr:sigma-70 family RNA polymerase sigma factor [Chitinophaga niastensis]PSL49861.1 RNA polymerase sigma-70 factor (ECF subfamily) [Chitinophaga niastensis]
MIDEVLLLQQLAAGDREAYTALYKYYQPKLCRYLLPFTGNTSDMADEITQDIFVKVWLKKETFIGLQAFEYYLYRMARNRLMDIFRSEKKRKQQDARLQEQEQPDYQLEDELKYREYHQLAQTAISRLPERRKLIFELSTQQDLSWAEIATQLDLSVAVVKKQLHLASRFIKDYMRKHGDIVISLLLFIALKW